MLSLKLLLILTESLEWSIRLKPHADKSEEDNKGTKYLSIQPVAVSLNFGLLLWLTYDIDDDGERLVIKLDKRAEVYAVNIKNLPKGPTVK